MNLLIRTALVAVLAAFFANLWGHWVDPTAAAIVSLVIFFGGLALYRRIWVRRTES